MASAPLRGKSEKKTPRRLEVPAWNCRKVGTRSRQCRPKVPGRFAFLGARNPRIYSLCGVDVRGYVPGLFFGDRLAAQLARERGTLFVNAFLKKELRLES